jgi:hypothetical protein
MEFTSMLIAGAKGPELFTQNTIAAAKASAEMEKGMYDLKEGIVGVASLLTWFLPGGWVFRIIKGATTLIGAGATAYFEMQKRLVNTNLEIQTKGYEQIRDAYKKTEDSFHAVSSIGVTLAHGMTSLSQFSVMAGVDIKEFSEGIKASSSSIHEMGMTSDRAVARLAGVSRQLHVVENGRLGKQLYALGLSTQEQVEASAEVMARLNVAGDKRIRKDSEVAAATVEYVKDLRVLQNITGGQAKEAMKKARDEATKLEFLSLAARAGNDGQEKIQRTLLYLNTLDEGLATAIKSYARFGTTTDVAARIGMQNNQGLQQLMDGVRNMIYDNSLTSKDVDEIMIGLLKTAGDKSIENAKTQKLIGQEAAASLGNSQELNSVITYENSLIRIRNTLGKQTIDQARKDVEEQAKAKTALDKNFTEFSNNLGLVNAKFQKDIFPRLVIYSGQVASASKQFQTNIESLKSIDDYLRAAFPSAFKGKSKGGGEGGNVPATPRNSAGAPTTDSLPVGNERGSNDARNYMATHNPDGSLKAGGGVPGSSLSGISVKGAETTAGGATNEKLLDLVRQLTSQFPDLMVSAANDSWHQEHRPNSPHTRGQAVDVKFRGMGEVSAKGITKLMRSLGFDNDSAKAIWEKPSGPNNPNGHIHIQAEMEKGGVVDPVDGGQVVKVGEAGRREGIFPANKNDPFPFHLDDRQFNKLLSALTGHMDVSKKILGSL